MSELKIFSGRSNRPLAKQICTEAKIPLGEVAFQTFSDGELWVKFIENIRGDDVFIIQPTQPPAENLMELLIMLDAAKRASAKRVTAVIPYFGYARQDKMVAPRADSGGFKHRSGTKTRDTNTSRSGNTTEKYRGRREKTEARH